MTIKDIKYEEVGKNYRFFLTWRYGIFAAHLVVLFSSLTTGFTLLEKKVDPFIVGLILIITSIITLCLWIAELRNRELYRGLIQKGKELEDSEYEAYSILVALSKVRKRWRLVTQSVSLDILAFICFVVLSNCGIILLQRPNFFDLQMDYFTYATQITIIIVDILFFIIIDPLGLKYIYINRKIKKKKNSSS
jgi:hypothetical protein